MLFGIQLTILNKLSLRILKRLDVDQIFTLNRLLILKNITVTLLKFASNFVFRIRSCTARRPTIVRAPVIGTEFAC